MISQHRNSAHCFITCPSTIDKCSFKCVSDWPIENMAPIAQLAVCVVCSGHGYRDVSKLTHFHALTIWYNCVCFLIFSLVVAVFGWAEFLLTQTDKQLYSKAATHYSLFTIENEGKQFSTVESNLFYGSKCPIFVVQKNKKMLEVLSVVTRL